MLENLDVKTLSWKLDSNCCKVAPRKPEVSMGASSASLATTSMSVQSQSTSPSRRYRPLPAHMLENLRSKIKAASYTGTSGRELDVIFERFDKDGSGQLDPDEVRQALRRTMRIT